MNMLMRITITTVLCFAFGLAQAQGVASLGGATSSNVRILNPQAFVIEASWLPTYLGGMDVSVGRFGPQDWVGSYSYLSVQKTGSYQFGQIRPFYGLGLLARTWTDQVDRVLSTPVNFSLSAGLDVGRLRVQYRHASNAGLSQPNHGQNWVLIGWRF